MRRDFFKNARILRYVVIQLGYTLFIVAVTFFLTYAVLLPRLNQRVNIVQSVSDPTSSQDASTNQSDYVERGSAYDNRTVDNATESSNVIFHGPRDKKRIALTFDAEMTEGMKTNYLSGKAKSSYDNRIVDTLNSTQTKATFFLTGMWIELYPDVTQQFSNNPLFELGSHSYSDRSYYGFCYGLKKMPSTVRVEDIGATEKLLREHAGIDNRLFRFPGGCYSPDDVKLVNEANDIVVHWDVSGVDGFNTSSNQIIRNVVDNAQNGSIIILHLNGAPTSPKTAEALPSIISQLKAKGFEFVKISELLGLPPAPHTPAY
jgi:peptidoglycan/xylan/chitin deacetylase (PgdA/CDA1 family)